MSRDLLDGRAVIGTHDEPHFMQHPITDDDWCQCSCRACFGHVEGLEGLDCLCEPCGCHKENYELGTMRRTTMEWLGGD